MEDWKHKEFWHSVYLFNDDKKPNFLINLGAALGLGVGAFVFGLYSYGKNTPPLGECFLVKGDPNTCTNVPIADAIDLTLKWNVWIQWGFWIMLISSLMFLSALGIGSAYKSDWAKVSGVFYHIVLLFLSLSTLVWYVWGPFMFMDPVAACCNKFGNLQADYKFVHDFYYVTFALILIAFCVHIVKKRQEREKQNEQVALSQSKLIPASQEA